MINIKTYLDNLKINLAYTYKEEKEYLQAVNSFIDSIYDLDDLAEDIIKYNLVERLIIPDRIITFKVPWVNDLGHVIVNTGYRIQFNNSIGPYKGGTRFDSSVNQSILKFLAFEQTLKNSLTNLPIGGAKGGSDFSPKGKSEFEIMRFAQSYMKELYKYIGPDIDSPAGDLGVSGETIGYMFGEYKRLTNRHNESITSKNVIIGGSLLRPEATGYGLVYIANKALDTYYNDSFKNKKVVISGSGNVSINAARKAIELGAKVIAMSATTGVIYNEEGISIPLLLEIKNNKKEINKYLDLDPNAKYYKDLKEIWKIKADIYLPSATQNEIDFDDAKIIAANKPIGIFEGANMPTTNEARKYFVENNILLIPSKAANAGGVITSTFEMEQNATHSIWSIEEVDIRLKARMENIFENIYNEAINLGNKLDLVKAANSYSVRKVLLAIKYQGV